ncbi:MAG: DUF1343 domain-containing protein [Flavobacteriales bacterium]|nr:DUF1343 domain-containing protein [Flavobacteriales bacterium]
MSYKVTIKFLCTAFLCAICSLSLLAGSKEEPKKGTDIQPGAAQYDQYLHLLQGKRVAFTGNHTSIVGDKHLVDILMEKGINIVKAFAPEHGFRGTADAGERVNNEVDEKTGINIVSLYGKMSKPTPEILSDVDVLLFDIQDVGARFYTYINTMQRIMEAGGENNIPVIVLDRPNPNGYYIDGPILKDTCISGIGMQPVPIVYGMTIGEYALMLNGEGWMKKGVKCDLKVIPCVGYTHKSRYSLPVPPSPNLPTDRSVNLFPSTCLFEGTPLSEGRGTDWPFEVFGSPLIDSTATDFTFTPAPNFGDKRPKQRGKVCYGMDLRSEKEQKEVNLDYIIWAYNNYTDKEKFFNHRGFAIRIGNYEVEDQIKAGMSAKEIKKDWKKGIEDFKKIRAKYLIYK